MFNVFRSKEDGLLSLVTNSDALPVIFNNDNWVIETKSAEVSSDIAHEVISFGFVLLRSNLPIGTRTTYGLMP